MRAVATAHLSNIYTLRSYCTEKTLFLYYKGQPGAAAVSQKKKRGGGGQCAIRMT